MCNSAYFLNNLHENMEDLLIRFADNVQNGTGNICLLRCNLIGINVCVILSLTPQTKCVAMGRHDLE